MLNKITIYVRGLVIKSENVEEPDIASHLATRGSFATESQVLLAFIKSKYKPYVIQDWDGDTWELVDEVSQSRQDVYTYKLNSTKAG